MWPIKGRKQTAARIAAKSSPLQQAAGMCRYGSLNNINPSAPDEQAEGISSGISGHFSSLGQSEMAICATFFSETTTKKSLRHNYLSYNL